MTKVKTVDPPIPIGVVLSEYECITWSFPRLVSAIGRSEKRLRKLERGKRVFGTVVFNQRAIDAEKTKLIALWRDVETIAGVCTGTLGVDYLEDISSVAVQRSS